NCHRSCAMLFCGQVGHHRHNCTCNSTGTLQETTKNQTLNRGCIRSNQRTADKHKQPHKYYWLAHPYIREQAQRNLQGRLTKPIDAKSKTKESKCRTFVLMTV